MNPARRFAQQITGLFRPRYESSACTMKITRPFKLWYHNRGSLVFFFDSHGGACVGLKSRVLIKNFPRVIRDSIRFDEIKKSTESGETPTTVTCVPRLFMRQLPYVFYVRERSLINRRGLFVARVETTRSN